MVEVTDSESDSTGVVKPTNVIPCGILVWKPMVETNFRSKDRQRATSRVFLVYFELDGCARGQNQNWSAFVFPTD